VYKQENFKILTVLPSNRERLRKRRQKECPGTPSAEKGQIFKMEPKIKK